MEAKLVRCKVSEFAGRWNGVSSMKACSCSLSLHRTGKTMLDQMMPSVLMNMSQTNMASGCAGGLLANELVSLFNRRVRGHGLLENPDRAAMKPFVVLDKTRGWPKNT